MKKNFFILIALFSVFFMACQKNQPLEKNKYVPSSHLTENNFFDFPQEVLEQAHEIAIELEKYKATGASLEQMDQYVRILTNEPLQKDWAFEDLLNWINDQYESTFLYQLNYQEINLYYENRVKTILALNAAYLAKNWTNENFNSGFRNGNADAFRHCIWNFMMALDVNLGAVFAKRFSDAHEYGAYQQPYLEEEMDLYNNGIGLYLAYSYPYLYKKEDIIQKVKDKLYYGYLKIIKNDTLSWSDRTGAKN